MSASRTVNFLFIDYCCIAKLPIHHFCGSAGSHTIVCVINTSDDHSMKAGVMGVFLCTDSRGAMIDEPGAVVLFSRHHVGYSMRRGFQIHRHLLMTPVCF